MVTPQTHLSTVGVNADMLARVLLTARNPLALGSLAKDLAQSQFCVTTAYNPDECLDLLQRSHPDVVILDAHFDTASGLAVCYRIRRESSIPVILLNEYAGSLDVVLALEVGADLCLPKPISEPLVTAAILRLLKHKPSATTRQSTTPLSSSIRRGNLTLIPDNYEIVVEQNRIQLTVQELAFLKILMETPQKVVTLQEIWDKLYISGTPVRHSAISMLAHRVRNKIEPDPKNPHYLIPYRGKGGGYRIAG